MNKMNSFLKEVQKMLHLKEPLVFVIGNESCDLDSAVCAVSLAYFYAKTTNTPEYLLTNGKRNFLPVMNIARANLPLKTEVIYFMKKNNIDVENLVCCNEVPIELLTTSKAILVDHHVATPLFLTENIIQIIDHRPLDTKNARIPIGCHLRASEVGSCASLITDEIRTLESSRLADYADILRMLQGPIVLDTINFSPSADKARSLDIEINREIENVLGLSENDRKKLFHQLVQARSDVSSLTALQLLSKDLKIVSNGTRTAVVAIPGFPILVEDYMQKENVQNSLRKFGDERNCDLLVLMGMKELPGGGIRRDLGVVSLRPSNITQAIVDAITIENAQYLQLEQKRVGAATLDAIPCVFYEQKNVKASRKQILPIVQKLLDTI